MELNEASEGTGVFFSSSSGVGIGYTSESICGWKLIGVIIV